MFSTPSSPLLLVVLVIAALIFLIQRFLTPQKDAREPPYIPSNVPIIGHILSLMRQGSDYFRQLNTRYNHGIYTLPMLSGRMYLVASPDWAIAVHRAHKTLQFNTLIAQAIKSLFSFDNATNALVDYNLNGENGTRDGIIIEIHDMMQGVLAPGPLLDALNRSILNNIAVHVNQLAVHGPQRLAFWTWLRHHFSIASVAAIWGPRNPFALHPEAEEAFWVFESNATALTMVPYPQLFARQGSTARQAVFDAFYEYMDAEAYNDAGTSELIKNRVKINMGKYGLTKKMFAHGEASLLFGALVNTVPTAFWLLAYIFEDAALLADIRGEVDKCVTADSASKRTMHIGKLRSACPLFSSAFREVLRMYAPVHSNRFVAADTTITNHTTGQSYVLKKDAVVQIATSVIHFKSPWGPDAASFNARRFLSTGERAKSETQGSDKLPDPAAPYRDSEGKIHGSAYRSFGGGNNICPGRFFAQTEVLGLVSLFVAGFEVGGAREGERFVTPPEESWKMSFSATKPGRDVDVVVKRREGYEGVEWTFAT